MLTFGIRSTLSATDNYNLEPDNSESAELFDNRLSFGYEARRANDVLSLDLSGVLRANEPPNGSNTFDDRRARLGYDRQGVNSALSFGADYSLASVDSRDPFDDNLFFEDDPLEEADLTEDRGTRSRSRPGSASRPGSTIRWGSFSRGATATAALPTRPIPICSTPRYSTCRRRRASRSARSPRRVWCCATRITAPRTCRRPTGRPAASIWGSRRRCRGSTRSMSRSGFQEIETDETILGVRRTDTDTGSSAASISHAS